MFNILSIFWFILETQYLGSSYFQVQPLRAETTTRSKWKQQNDVSLLCAMYPNVKLYVLFQHKYIAVRMSWSALYFFKLVGILNSVLRALLSTFVLLRQNLWKTRMTIDKRQDKVGGGGQRSKIEWVARNIVWYIIDRSKSWESLQSAYEF